MEKLSEEERERIRKEAYENALELYHFESEAVRGQYAEILIKGMESECLKKNEEIERLKKQYNDLGVKFDKELERWQERDIDEVNKRKELEKQLIEMASTTRYTEMNLRNQIYALESDRENRIARELTLEDEIKSIKALLGNNFEKRNIDPLEELESKLQASEQRVEELENQWSNHRINYTCSGRNSEF